MYIHTEHIYSKKKKKSAKIKTFEMIMNCLLQLCMCHLHSIYKQEPNSKHRISKKKKSTNLLEKKFHTPFFFREKITLVLRLTAIKVRYCL